VCKTLTSLRIIVSVTPMTLQLRNKWVRKTLKSNADAMLKSSFKLTPKPLALAYHTNTHISTNPNTLEKAYAKIYFASQLSVTRGVKSIIILQYIKKDMLKITVVISLTIQVNSKSSQVQCIVAYSIPSKLGKLCCTSHFGKLRIFYAYYTMLS